MDKLLGKALEIAWKAHEGQTDKGGHPYIRHPLSVAGQLDTDEEIMTALLHDVVEDTEYTMDDLKREGFPPPVIEALELLIRDPQVEYLEYVRRIRPNELARRVKLADLWHNSHPGRLARPLTGQDLQRLEKYRKARAILNGEEDGCRPV